MENAFRPEQLKRDLATLSPLHWVAFCADVSERLLPNYTQFSRVEGYGRPDLLRHCLDLVWKHIEGAQLAKHVCTALATECADAAPYPDEFESEFASAALDAANGVAATLLCCRDKDVDRCVEVAIYARDTVDMFVQIHGLVDETADDLERQILDHPLMMREVARQREVLSMLKESSVLDSSIVEHLRGQSGNLKGHYSDG